MYTNNVKSLTTINTIGELRKALKNFSDEQSFFMRVEWVAGDPESGEVFRDINIKQIDTYNHTGFGHTELVICGRVNRKR